MRVYISLFIIFIFSSCLYDTQSIKSLNSDSFELLLNDTKSSKILDVRTPEEFLSGNLEGSQNINFYDKDFLKQVKSSFSSNDSIYIYCRSGGRSFKAAKILEKEGFKYIFNLKGGIISWQENGNRIIKKEDSNILEISLLEFKEILSENESVLVDFGAPWCGPCKKMEPIIKEIEQENIFDQVIFINIDYIEQDLRDFCKIRQKQSIPLFMIFRDGKETFRHLGLISKEDLINVIN